MSKKNMNKVPIEQVSSPKFSMELFEDENVVKEKRSAKKIRSGKYSVQANMSSEKQQSDSSNQANSEQLPVEKEDLVKEDLVKEEEEDD